jgi:hypothetical protein
MVISSSCCSASVTPYEPLSLSVYSSLLYHDEMLTTLLSYMPISRVVLLCKMCQCSQSLEVFCIVFIFFQNFSQLRFNPNLTKRLLRILFIIIKILLIIQSKTLKWINLSHQMLLFALFFYLISGNEF